MDRRVAELRMFVQRERRRFKQAQMEIAFCKIITHILITTTTTNDDQVAVDDNAAISCYVKHINEFEVKQLDVFSNRLANMCLDIAQHYIWVGILKQTLLLSMQLYDAVCQLGSLCVFCLSDISKIDAATKARVLSFGEVIQPNMLLSITEGINDLRSPYEVRV